MPSKYTYHPMAAYELKTMWPGPSSTGNSAGRGEATVERVRKKEGAAAAEGTDGRGQPVSRFRLRRRADGLGARASQEPPIPPSFGVLTCDVCTGEGDTPKLAYY